MYFRIIGGDKATGRNVDLIVDCTDENAASKYAQIKGISVVSIQRELASLEAMPRVKVSGSEASSYIHPRPHTVMESGVTRPKSQTVKFRTKGTDQETGEDMTVYVECADAKAASTYAHKMGILVSFIHREDANSPAITPRQSIDGSSKQLPYRALPVPASNPPPIQTPMDSIPVKTSALPSSYVNVSRVKEVKAVCHACGNVWYYKPGERLGELGKKMQRFGANMQTLGSADLFMRKAESLTTRCPKCNSGAISRETVINEIVTPRKLGFFEKALREKQLEAERGLSPDQLTEKRKRGRIITICVIVALPVMCLLGNLLPKTEHTSPVSPLSAPPSTPYTPMSSPAAEKDDSTFMQETISKAKYDQIRTGMSYNDVSDIIHHAGESVSSNKIEGCSRRHGVHYHRSI